VYIPELIIPGNSINLPDPDQAHAVESQLYAFESGLDEAAVALDLFEQAQAHVDPRVNAESWRREIDRQATIRAKYEMDDGTAASSDSPEAQFYAEMWVRLRAEAAAKREDWAAGNLPKEYRRLLPFMYAKVFVYAIDSIRKALRELKRVASLPADVITQVDAFNVAFPTLGNVRNSTAHEEQRRLGVDRHGDPIPLTEPVLVTGSLRGNRYGGTTEAGDIQEVEVSAATLEQACRIVQAVLDALPWKRGVPRHHPSWTGP
jgi:hypothetical protein